MTKRRIVSLAAALLCCAAMAGGCSSSDSAKNPALNTERTADKTVGYQLNKPQSGDQIAIVRLKIGDSEEKKVYIRLFPEAAPKAVENFIYLSQNGKYDGLIFHRVVEDLVIQGGDPNGDGSGGESKFTNAAGEKHFEDEFTDKVLNLRGAVAMANSGVDTNGSQFFFNMMPADDVLAPEVAKANLETAKKQFKQYRSDYRAAEMTFQDVTIGVNSQYPPYTYYNIPPLPVPDDVLKLYKQEGGNVTWDGAWRSTGGHSVFGQVFDGMEVLEEINGVGVNANGKPDEDVKIVGIDITNYQG